MSFFGSEDARLNARIFLEHHLGEAEVSRESLREHLRVKDRLPRVGEPLWYLPHGVTDTRFAIPYGKVIRVETELT